MDIRLLEQVLEELKDSLPEEIIPSTMGEPLLYEHFVRIVELCKQYGVRLNLTTNGTFPVRGVREWASLILPVGSDVKVSINGATTGTQEAIMVNSRRETVLENIRIFVSMRDEWAATGGNYCSVSMQTTFMEKNIEEMPDLIRLAARLNVDRVKGHHLWVHYDEMREQDLRRSPESVHRWNRIAERCRTVAEETPRPNGKLVKLEHFMPTAFQKQSTSSQDAECPFLGREAWINHAGRFDPCCAPDALRQSLGRFGTVQQEGFMTIWQGPAYLALMKSYPDRALCQSCLMRKPVDG
jgi:MoaA/NifB/PqqE/SkfB family radical SAM enzyme